MRELSNVKELYKQKLQSAEEAIKLVQNGDTIVVSYGEPTLFLTALSDHRREYQDVKISQYLGQIKWGFCDPETYDNVRQVTLFTGSAQRQGAQEGWVDFIPNSFSGIPTLFRRRYAPCDIYACTVSPMDEFGYFSMSMGPDYGMAAAEVARDIVFEVNPNYSFANGNNLVHISQVTAIIESNVPQYEIQVPPPTPLQEIMAGYVAEKIEDGSTIQVGFGPPNALVSQLAHKRDLGVHSEMLNDGILYLIECGAVTNRKKNFMPGKCISTFALGSRKLYDFQHRNPMVEMHPCEFVNSPWIAGRNDNLISINAALEVDFLGQCASESIGTLSYSGSGGQADFVYAAFISRGGKSFIMLPSTAQNGKVSRITPTLTPGAHVTTHKNIVDYIVTEYGIAHLQGKSIKERTKELIAIAHPDFRAELREAAKKLNYL